MKKLCTLFLAAICVGSVLGQTQPRFKSIELKTQNGDVIKPICTANLNPANGIAEGVEPTIAQLGTWEMIFLPGTDLSNVQATVTTNNVETTIVSPTEIPTNWSSTITFILKNGDLYTHNKVSAKVLTPAPLPLFLETSGKNNIKNSWEWDSKTDIGWAGAGLDKEQKQFRLGSANRALFVAFSDEPDELEYTIGGSNAWVDDNVLTVDGSADGLTWTNIETYNDANPYVKYTDASPVKTTINSEFRFVRWLLTSRKTINTNIGNIKITKKTDNPGTGILTPQEQSIKAYFNASEIQLANADLISNISLYNTTGALVLSQNNPAALMDASNMSNGVYIAKISTTAGNTISMKLIKK